MELLIVGAGEMGQWVARTVSTDVAITDVDAERASEALEALGRGDERSVRTVGLDTADRFDAVCMAVPIPAVTDAIEAHAGRATRAIFDVTGTMAQPLAAMDSHASGLERASFHPLFGASAAPGTVAVSTGSAGPVIERIEAEFEAAGNTLREFDAQTHDDAMQTIQGRAHAAVLAFGLAAEAVPDGLETPVYEGLLELLSQVTGGTPRVYGDIQAAFDGATEIASAAQRLARADTDNAVVLDGDEEPFESLYHEAGESVTDASE